MKQVINRTVRPKLKGLGHRGCCKLYDEQQLQFQRWVEACDNLYNTALAFCYSIEAQQHGRASTKARALEDAVRRVAITSEKLKTL